MTKNEASNPSFEKQSRFALFMDELYDLFFRNRKAHHIIYLCAFLISLSYASVSDLVLGRPQERVLIESIALALALLIVLPVVYLAISSPKKVTEDRDEVVRTENPDIEEPERHVSSVVAQEVHK